MGINGRKELTGDGDVGRRFGLAESVEGVARVFTGVGRVDFVDDQLEETGGGLVVDHFEPIGRHHFLAIFPAAMETIFRLEIDALRHSQKRLQFDGGDGLSLHFDHEADGSVFDQFRVVQLDKEDGTLFLRHLFAFFHRH